MKSIPNGSIDAVFCDLPFQMTNNNWDILIPMDRLWAEYNRICKKSAAIVLNSMLGFTAMLINSNPKMFKYSWVWDKKNPTGFLNAKKQPLRRTEDICVFYKKQCTYNPKMEIRGKPRNKGYYNKPGGSDNYGTYHNVESFNNEYYPTNLIEISNAKKKGKRHPCEKPVELMEYLISTYTNPGDLILDNCCGAGATLVAAKNLGRQYIGIEKEEKFYNISVDRLKG